MNAAKLDRTQICGSEQARTRLRHAMLYMQVAEVALSEESAENATVATGNAVLAGIAALLRDLIDLKDAGHYGLRDLSAARAKSAIRKAGRLVDAARDRVR